MDIGDKMQTLFEEYGFSPDPGLHNCFYRRIENGDRIMMMKIPDDYDNTTPYSAEVERQFLQSTYEMITMTFSLSSEKQNVNYSS